MAATDVQDELMLDEDAYNESDDEDFDPNAAGAPGEDSSADDNDDDASTAQSKTTKAKKKQLAAKRQGDEAEDVGFENSGDEAVVKRGVKRRKKHAAGDAAEDSGGEGGFVKTRSMRATAAEEQGRKPLATTAGATVDVNALWAEMNDPKASSQQRNTARPPTADGESPKKGQPKGAKEPVQPQDVVLDDNMVEIEETIEFAGEVQKRKKLVPRASEEAQKWLKAKSETAENGEPTDLASTTKAKRHPDTGEALLRPLRRVSLWDPNPTGVVKGLPTNILSDTTAGNKLRVVDKSKLKWHSEDTPKKAPKATKLNVVEKSKMDWRAHVDETGDKEELEKAAKAKGSYLERRDFLERVEARKEDEERRHRVK